MKSFNEYVTDLTNATIDVDKLDEAVNQSDKDLVASIKRLSVNLVKLDPTNEVDSKSYYKLAKTLCDSLTELLKRK